EARFRKVEQAVVRRAVAGSGRVIATGGGAVLSAAARRALRQAGPVFYLKAPLEVLVQRAGSASGRPLLGTDPRAALERLLREREAFYVETGTAVDAARPVEAVADDILARLSATRRRVRVDLGPRSYDVLIGAGALPLVGEDLKRIGANGQVAVITQRPIASRFGARVTAALDGCGFSAHVLTAPGGERAKSLRQAAALVDALGALGITRSDTIVAMGGGVVGDLAGFVAGIYMRGVRLVQVPTTLLAQIDSAIGGKTAVNHPRAKNLVGVYHQPALVIADVETLASLPTTERRAGLAEAVKYGMVLDADLFERLERGDAGAALAGAPHALEEIVFRCASLKAQIVAGDEREHGPREVLNYGHTVGHAVEIVWAGHLIHGEAISIGMRVEAALAVRLGLLEADAAGRQDALLAGLGLPVRVPAGPIGAVMDAIQLDKKRRNGRIRCSLPEGIGRARLGVDVPESLMEEVITACQRSS
ncbi:MAG: 3-dehydroquinate synthase, partial [Armatimonadota bacterium]|nr:3-dehydroquinate synthase [Armatimonadota bacterium]